ADLGEVRGGADWVADRAQEVEPGGGRQVEVDVAANRDRPAPLVVGGADGGGGDQGGVGEDGQRGQRRVQGGGARTVEDQGVAPDLEAGAGDPAVAQGGVVGQGQRCPGLDGGGAADGVAGAQGGVALGE